MVLRWGQKGMRLIPRAATVGKLMSLLSLDRAMLALQRKVFGNAFLRAVFYHDTPPSEASNLEAHFAYYREHFVPVSLDEAAEFLETGCWKKEAPGIMVWFDDALRTNYHVALPLLKKYSLVGWFSIPTGFVDAAEANSAEWATEHSIVPRHAYDDGRVCLSWNEVRDLDSSGHVICSHTVNHHRMVSSTSQEHMEYEIVASKARLEEMLGHEVPGFTWVGGEEWTYNRAALDIARQAGYRYCFTSLLGLIHPRSNPYFLNRIGVESPAGLDVVRLQLCGLMDMVTATRRRRVRKALFEKR
jgi:peptidoglycan/xylan/chitin deacetylase (PgdA/CDA1 family)